MPAYTTELNMPLVGLSADAVLAEVQRALAGDERIERVSPNASGEHLAVVVRLLASTPGAAHELVVELHERALHAVLAAAPADHGWTSEYALPEPAPE